MACGSANESDAGTAAFTKPDPELAKRLVKEAGYAGEPIVLMDAADQPIMHQMILVMAQAMRDAGMNVDLQSTDWGTVVTRSARNDRPGSGSPGWHMFASWAPGRVVGSPLTATQLRTPCNLTTFFPSPVMRSWRPVVTATSPPPRWRRASRRWMPSRSASTRSFPI